MDRLCCTFAGVLVQEIDSLGCSDMSCFYDYEENFPKSHYISYFSHPHSPFQLTTFTGSVIQVTK